MGVTFDETEKKFVFDFEHDGANDIVSLTGNGYQVEAFGKCFYYGYEFSEQVESSIRTMIRQQNVLVVDDVTTSGSTLNEVLRTLRILNEDNEITIFSLIGRKDLMAESL